MACQNSWFGLCLAALLAVPSLAPRAAGQQQMVSSKLQFNATSKLTNSLRNPLTDFEISNLLAVHQHHERPRRQRDQLERHQEDSLSGLMLKTFIRTNNMRAFHIDIHSYRPEAKFSGDPAFVDSQSAGHKQRCANNLRHYHDQLISTNQLDSVLTRGHHEALYLADTFGRPPAGVLAGNQFWVGDYDACKSFKLTGAPSGEPIQGHYCVGLSSFPNWNPSDTMRAIKVGLCLPETCTSSMLNEDRELFKTVERMMKNQFTGSKLYEKLQLRSVYCLPHESSQARQLSTSSLAFLAVVGAFVVGAVIATLLDHQKSVEFSQKYVEQPRNWKVILVESFSISRNLKKLFSIRADRPKRQPEAQPGTSKVIDSNASISPTMSSPVSEQSGTQFSRANFLNITAGIKCIGIMWIISAHCLLIVPIMSRNLINMDQITSTYLANFLLSAHLMVDTFFVFSGMLASYFVFKEQIDRFKLKHWIVITVHRYWRLTPVYLLCFWFAKSMAVHLGSGPLWDYMTSEQSLRLNCARESWLSALLHMADFKGPKEHCHPFAWFISNGMKFWIVTPLFLILINKSIFRGYGAALGAILANIATVYWLASKTTVDLKDLIAFKPESSNDTLDKMSDIYVRPYSRIGAYLIGLLAGHLFHRLETRQVSIKISKHTSRFIWTLWFVLIGALTFMLRIAQHFPMEESEMRSTFSVSSALIRPLWALCTCWLVFALSTGQAVQVARFLSANFWRICVRLTFAAYLVQSELLALLYLSQDGTKEFNTLELLKACIVVNVLTFIMSIPMVVLFEYPLVSIEELILPKRNKKEICSAGRSDQGNSIANATKDQPTSSEMLQQHKLKSS